MRLTTFLAIALFAFAGSAFAQTLKIGYANIEAILAYMPETQTMNQELATYERKLGQNIEAKRMYLQSLVEDFESLQQTTQDTAVLAPKYRNLLKVEQEIQQAANDAQQKLLAKREEMMKPIVEKLQKEITAISDAEGYTYIFNTVDGSGVSILLKGPEEHDLTKKIMARLGIKLPEDQPAAAAGSN
ncbi:MAG: OmpH family outer membrane protein [Bacteroidia bacterium]|nr:OmpH family outer membrane protein [Bacteroidia bacterium]